MAKSYKVLAPYVTLKVPDDATGALVIRGFYAGAPVPDDIDPANLQHHIDSGLVVEDDGGVVAEQVAVPAGTPIPGEPPNVPVTFEDSIPRTLEDRTTRAVKAAEKVAEDAKTGKAPADKPADEPPADGTPPRSASKDAWRQYALSVEVARGRDEAEARAELDPFTRDELVEKYGK